MKKLTTPGGLKWTQDRVCTFRRDRRIRKSKPKEGEDVLTMNQAQAYLDISHNALLALARKGVIDPNQVIDFAPWRIARQTLDSEEVQGMVRVLKATGRLPKGGSPKTQPGLFDANKGVRSKVGRGAL